MPELKDLAQNQIINHIQASNRPVDGNGACMSNFVALDDISSALLNPCLERAKGFYTRFHNGEGFLLEAETMQMSLASLELPPKEWEAPEINTFERFLQHAVQRISNTQQ